MMDYEKKYKEALERARAKYAMKDQPIHQDLVDLFPELKESEDTEIKRLIKVAINGWFTSEGMIYEKESVEETKKKCLSWVEKQGEQKHADKVEPRFKINDKVIHKETGKTWTIHWYLADTNSYYVIDEEELINHYSEDVLESAEQKHAEWSEEDESHIRYLIECLEHCKKGVSLTMTAPTAQEYIDWLKFLRPQPQWKPSGEQMNGLKEAIEFLGCTKTRRKQLQSLYEQLKKLRKE